MSSEKVMKNRSMIAVFDDQELRPLEDRKMFVFVVVFFVLLIAFMIELVVTSSFDPLKEKVCKCVLKLSRSLAAFIHEMINPNLCQRFFYQCHILNTQLKIVYTMNTHKIYLNH